MKIAFKHACWISYKNKKRQLPGTALTKNNLTYFKKLNVDAV